MSIKNYIKEIGRGKDGARQLSRVQAADLMQQVLDRTVSELELGAFVLAMRIKGETAQEMAGFLDALDSHLVKIPNAGCPTVVLPSYNGARKLPVLTPLLALLLAREGLAVVMHGCSTEAGRVTAPQVLAQLGIDAQPSVQPAVAGRVVWYPTQLLSPSLQALLDVRQVVGLRNSGHSMVKLMNPCDGPALVVGSYTHPEYAVSMAATFELIQANALLLRGTEGEPVADPRRSPAMTGISQGHVTQLQATQTGALAALPQLPAPDAASTALWIQAVLAGQAPVPAPIAQQVAHITQLCQPFRNKP
jgi:anthranilate phosphoribosyltransferase